MLDKLPLNIRALIVLIPALALSLCSLFKPTIISSFSEISLWGGNIFYWALRLCFFMATIGAIYLFFNKTSISPFFQKKVSIPDALHNPLLGVRALAFLLVLFGHYFMLVFQPTEIIKLIADGNIIWLITASPWGGVWVFFTLSGYLMGKGFASERYDSNFHSLINFYRNRALRILPLYYVAIFLVGALVSPSIFDIRQPKVAADLVSILTFDSLVVPPIWALWSVSTEVQFYFVMPFIWFTIAPILNKKFGFFILTLIIVTISISYKYFMLASGMDWHQFVYLPLLPNLDVFLIGMLTSYAVHVRRTSSLKQFRHGIKIAIGLCGLLWVGLSYWSADAMLIGSSTRIMIYLSNAPIATALLTALIIYYLENSQLRNPKKNFVPSVLWRASSVTGVLTYSLYVWHEPLLLSFRKTLPPIISLGDSLAYFFFVVPAIFLCAFFFYRQFELPFDKKRKI